MTSIKNVSATTAAYRTARLTGGLADISREATVFLFAILAEGESINPHTPLAKELISVGFVDYFGGIKPWLADNMGKAIEDLVASAGADLGPMAEPTTMKQLGHRSVKGKSSYSRTVVEAERKMRNTAFTVDRRVFALATGCMHELKREQRIALAALGSTTLPETFYFPVSYDYRGRMYYRGGIVTPQGDDLLKGLLRFADEAPIGKNGLSAICLSLADALGIKAPKRQAIAQVLATDLVAVGNGSHGFQAAGLAMEIQHILQWRDAGNAIEDFVSGIVCHQDATCSGLQIAAAITGHRDTAEATNCTASSPDDERADVYGEVSDICADSQTEIGQICRDYGRDAVKYAVMTLGYGAGRKTLIRTVGDFLLKKGLINVAAEDWIMDERSQKVFFEALEQRCGATIALMEALKTAASVAVARGDTITWTTTDGFEAVQHKTSGDVVESGQYRMIFDEKTDLELEVRAIAPNIVHSIDASQMRDAICWLNKAPVAAIHDSLGTRPCDYWEAGKQVRLAFERVKPRQVALDFCSKYGVELPIMGDYEPSEATESSYFWC